MFNYPEILLKSLQFHLQPAPEHCPCAAFSDGLLPTLISHLRPFTLIAPCPTFYCTDYFISRIPAGYIPTACKSSTENVIKLVLKHYKIFLSIVTHGIPVLFSSLSVMTILALSSWSSQWSCSNFRLEDFSTCSIWTRFFLSVVALRRFSAPSLIFSSFCIARRSSSFSPSSFCWKLGSIKFTPLPSCKRQLPCNQAALRKGISEITQFNLFFYDITIPS